MTPKTRRALEILRDGGPMSCSTFGARMWPERETSGVANQGGGDYPAQMLLGRLKRKGFVQHADSRGSSLWELALEGHDAVGPGTISCRPMRPDDIRDAAKALLDEDPVEAARQRARDLRAICRRILGRQSYLFVDVDGVLNSIDWQHELHEQGKRRDMRPDDLIDPAAMARLNRIIDATGAKVVVSSCWRTGRTVEQLGELFARHGFTGDVVGRTGHGFKGERGKQIREWLREFDEDDAPFAVLDDEKSDMGAVIDRLVKTDGRTGLQDEHVEEVVRRLNGEEGS